MSNEDSKASSGPPWLWIAALLGGGGTLGGLQFNNSTNAPPPAPAPSLGECRAAEDRAADAWQNFNGMVESYQLILKELLECKE